MEQEVFITPNLFIRENNIYYLNDKTKKEIKVTLKNWHKYLSDYGWEKMELGWKRRLKSGINSPYGVLDCGSHGDCLFLSIAEAYKNIYNPLEEIFTVESLRELVADQVTNKNYNSILLNYKLEQECGEFDGLWDPNEINSIEDLQNEIKKSGESFWGDHILIQLLEQALNINIILFNSENMYYERNYRLQPTGNSFSKDRRTIFLSYTCNNHFELVGKFYDWKMKTIFGYEDIPPEIKTIYKEDCNIEI